MYCSRSFRMGSLFTVHCPLFTPPLSLLEARASGTPFARPVADGSVGNLKTDLEARGSNLLLTNLKAAKEKGANTPHSAHPAHLHMLCTPSAHDFHTPCSVHLHLPHLPQIATPSFCRVSHSYDGTFVGPVSIRRTTVFTYSELAAPRPIATSPSTRQPPALRANKEGKCKRKG
jgi:hypothetical protein